MAHQAQNEYYPDREGLAMDYATCVNQEVKERFAAGADAVHRATLLERHQTSSSSDTTGKKTG